MGNSNLATYTKLSPNHSGKRTHTIDRITPHCYVGKVSVQTIGSHFSSKTLKASCNYGIAEDGQVALIVDESNRSWCSSNSANDQRAVTIECSSGATAPYAFSTTVYNKLVELCTDICERNGKKKLLWISDKSTALKYNPKSDEMVLTVHRWFARKSCPGDWMYSRMAKLATEVTGKLTLSTEQKVVLNYDLVFNPTYYANRYPDLAKNGVKTKDQLLNHFKTYGMKEKRVASANFDINVYSQYDDLKKAFGTDWKKYYEHFMKCGYKEGRKH